MQFDMLVFMHLMVFAEHLLCVSIVILAEHAIKNKLDEFLGLPHHHLPLVRADIPVRETSISKIKKNKM